MNCPKCTKEFEPHHHAQKYCNECRGVKEQGVTPADETVIPKRDTHLQEKYDESMINFNNGELSPPIDARSTIEREPVSTGDMEGDSLQQPSPLEVVEDFTSADTILDPLDVYSPERWSKLQGNYEFDPALGRARCKEMSSNIAFPSPGDPAYSDTPSGDEMLTFNDLPLGDRSTIERESNDGDPERTREVLIECALKYHKIFGNAHAHEFKGGR